jgi:diguanylate cyclase (GGDEF)-like protein
MRRRVYAYSAVVSVCVAAAATLAGVAKPASAAALAALAIPEVLVGLAILALIRGPGRRLTTQLALAAGLLPIVALALGIAVMPSAAPVAVTCLGLLLLAFGIFVPLEGRWHLSWLAAANLLFFGAAAGTSALAGSDVAATLAAAALGSGLSVAANRVWMRNQRQTEAQVVAAHDLYGRVRNHERELRRQEEFLLMQQQTLIAQQTELLQLNEDLESIARLDALTGLGNRLRLNEDLAQMAARIERSGGSAGLLLMDLDRFKRLNDSAGHLAGDDALKGVADVMRSICRAGDGLYRYGGEEFLVMLHDADSAALEAAGERYIRAIEAAAIPHPDNPPFRFVTASAGASLLSQANCRDVDAALRDADQALYRAKALGRNRLDVRLRRGGSVVPIEERRAAS